MGLGLRRDQGAQHLAEVLHDSEVALALAHHEPRAWHVFRQPPSVRGRREAVVAAIPKQHRTADRAQVDIPWPDPGDVVPATAAGSLAQSLAYRAGERRGEARVLHQPAVAG